MRQNVVSLAAVAVALFFFVRIASRLPWTPYRIAGIAILIPAAVLFVVARIQLGRAFSVKAEARTLVSTGLYARIRNPIYVFGALMIVGLIVWSGRPWFFLVFAILIPLQIYRTRREAQVLTEKFGDAYLEYRRKTWF